MKLSEIAQHLGAELIGNADLEITGVASIETATPDKVTFLANEKYARFLADSKAGAVIAKQRHDASERSFLIHPDPYYSFARCLRLFYELPQASLPAGKAASAAVAADANIAASAHVGEFVQVGSGTTVGDESRIMTNSVVGRNCKLGKNCLIYPNVTIYDDTIIGDNVTIHAGAVVGSDGYGYAQHQGVHYKVLQVGRVRIEDDVEIGANVTIDRAALGETVVGAGTKIDNLVQIAHNVQIGKGSLLVSQSGVSGSTRLGDYVVLAGQAGLVGHINIGDRVIVAAQSGVTNDVEPDKVVGGSPARDIRDWKKLEAHLSRLPDRMKELKSLRHQIEDLTERIARLEQDNN